MVETGGVACGVTTKLGTSRAIVDEEQEQEEEGGGDGGDGGVGASLGATSGYRYIELGWAVHIRREGSRERERDATLTTR